MKNITIDDIITITKSLKDENFRRELAKTNNIWNGEAGLQYNAISLVGPMMAICRESNADQIDDFIKHYFISKQHHLNLNELMDLTNQFAIQTNLSFDVAFAQVCHRLFFETYKGLQKEMDLKSLLNKHLNEGLSCKYSTEENDGKYAVDLDITKDDRPIYSIQVKPESYNNGHNSALNSQKKLNIKKNQKYLRKQNISTLYFYYGKDKEGKNIYTCYDKDVCKLLS